jgi:hypothetical protein
MKNGMRATLCAQVRDSADFRHRSAEITSAKPDFPARRDSDLAFAEFRNHKDRDGARL